MEGKLTVKISEKIFEKFGIDEACKEKLKNIEGKDTKVIARKLSEIKFEESSPFYGSPLLWGRNICANSKYWGTPMLIGLIQDEVDRSRERLATKLRSKKSISYKQYNQIMQEYKTDPLISELLYTNGETCDVCGNKFNVKKLFFKIGEITGEGNYCCSEPSAVWHPKRIELKMKDWPLSGMENIQYLFEIDEDWLRNFRNSLESLSDDYEWSTLKEILSGKVRTRGNLCKGCYREVYTKIPKGILDVLPYEGILPKDKIKRVSVVTY